MYFGDAPGSRILRAATTWDLQVASGLLKKQENHRKKQQTTHKLKKAKYQLM